MTQQDPSQNEKNVKNDALPHKKKIFLREEDPSVFIQCYLHGLHSSHSKTASENKQPLKKVYAWESVLQGEGCKTELLCMKEAPTLSKEKTRPAVLLCPGGSYKYISKREDKPVALAFFEAGFQVFSLHYSVDKNSLFPRPLVDLALALKYIRQHASDYRVRPQEIVLLGFSAGGNLVSMLGNHWQDDWLNTLVQSEAEDIRPNAQILSYALSSLEDIPMYAQALRGILQVLPSFVPDLTLPSTVPEKVDDLVRLYQNLVSKLPHEVLLSCLQTLSQHIPDLDKMGSILAQLPPALLSNQEIKQGVCPPTFLWHTREDETVPCQQALTMAQKLQEEKIPFEFHLFSQGPHALSMANETIFPNNPPPARIQLWFPLALDWLKTQLHFSLDELFEDKSKLEIASI